MIVEGDISKKSKLLQGAMPKRVQFNPASKAHRASVKHFLETGSWGQVLFIPELPHVEVPATVLTKLAAYSLGIKK